MREKRTDLDEPESVVGCHAVAPVDLQHVEGTRSAAGH